MMVGINREVSYFQHRDGDKDGLNTSKACFSNWGGSVRLAVFCSIDQMLMSNLDQLKEF